MDRLVFNCNQNQEHGLGHFFRCLNLARHLRKLNKFKISFIGHFSSFSTSVLINESFSFTDLQNQKYLLSSLEKFDYVVIDRYDINQLFLDELTRLKKTKSIFIDDFNQLDFSNQNLVINFRIGIENFKYKSKLKAIGENFFIFKPELLQVRENYKFREKVKNVLFFGSATNKCNDTFNDLPVFMLNNFHDIEVTHITNKPLSSENVRYHPKKFQFSIEKYLKKADVIFNGGGLIKYEAAFCGIPSATLSTTNEQHDDTLNLEVKEVLYNLGNQKIIDKEEVQKRVVEFVKDVSLRRRLHNKGIELFTLKSINNLIEKINEI